MSYVRITEGFISPLFHILLDSESHYMSDRAKAILNEITKWFTPPNATYIEMFGVFKSTYQLPLLVTDKIIIYEVAYQLRIVFRGTLA